MFYALMRHECLNGISQTSIPYRLYQKLERNLFNGYFSIPTWVRATSKENCPSWCEEMEEEEGTKDEGKGAEVHPQNIIHAGAVGRGGGE